MAHRVLNTGDEVREYERYLDEGWPEREAVAVHLAERLSCMDVAEPRVLELGCGPGALAAVLLEMVPRAAYTGVDITAASLEYARRRAGGPGGSARWLQCNLNEDGWLREVDRKYDAVLSMQSIHDLGGEVEVARIFGIAHRLIAPGGRLIYADLLRSAADAEGTNPGRFFVPRHVELVEAAGFVDVTCTMLIGGFGCFEAVVDRDGA